MEEIEKGCATHRPQPVSPSYAFVLRAGCDPRGAVSGGAHSLHRAQSQTNAAELPQVALDIISNVTLFEVCSGLSTPPSCPYQAPLDSVFCAGYPSLSFAEFPLISFDGFAEKDAH
eukprot:s802_g7.t3